MKRNDAQLAENNAHVRVNDSPIAGHDACVVGNEPARSLAERESTLMTIALIPADYLIIAQRFKRWENRLKILQTRQGRQERHRTNAVLPSRRDLRSFCIETQR